MTASQYNVLTALFQSGPVSDSDLVHHVKARRFDMTRSSIRSRRCELVKAGLVHAVSTQTSLRGRKEQVWDVTPKGVDAYVLTNPKYAQASLLD